MVVHLDDVLPTSCGSRSIRLGLKSFFGLENFLHTKPMYPFIISIKDLTNECDVLSNIVRETYPKLRQYLLLLVVVSVIRDQRVPVPVGGRLPHHWLFGQLHNAGVPFPAQNTKDARGGACWSTRQNQPGPAQVIKKIYQFLLRFPTYLMK